MPLDLVHPSPNISPETALSISQQAPPLLQSSRSLPWPLSLFTDSDTQDQWTTFENLFVSCLRTGDDESARKLLDKLVERFGEQNERVMAYQGMWAESRIDGDADFVKTLKEYGDALEADPANMHVQKRRIALLRSLNKLPEATSQLVNLVDVSPTDAEAWAELSDVYLSQSLYDQAIFAMEEVLLVMPNAWNMHARLAEIIYRSALSDSPASTLESARRLAEAMRRYCRSVELCNDYLRGYYGLKLTTQKLLEVLPTVGKQSSNTESAYSDLPLPSPTTVEKLHELATSKLGEIVRRSPAGERGWDGYDKAEIIAARELLNRDSNPAPR